MKTIFYFLLLYYSSNLFAQDLEKIKNSDIIYVYIDANNHDQIHHKEQTVDKTRNFDNYIFEIDSLNSIQFTHHYNLAKETKCEKRNFLKKNKDLIVTIQIMKKIGIVDTAKLFFKKNGEMKKIYMIEKDSIGWFKVLLKEVLTAGLNAVYNE